MQQQHVNARNHKHTQPKTTQWIDSLDLELIFMNSIAICIVLLAIVAADIFMP
ncbi:hypothetical protein [Kaarinaea lacus]